MNTQQKIQAQAKKAQIGFSSKRLTQTIRELKKSREESRFMNEFLPVGILVYQNYHVIYANIEAARLLKYDPSDLLGLPYQALVHPDFSELANKRIEAITRKQEAVPFLECPLVCQDGTTIYVEIKGTYTLYNGLPSVMVVFRDITDRKQREQELAQSELRYRTVIELSPDAILVNTYDQIIFANKKVMELYEVDSQEELMGQNGMQYIHPEDREFLMKKIQQDLKKAEGSSLDTLEIRIVTKKGAVRYTEASASPIQYKGNPALLVVFRDITKRKEMEQSLQIVYEAIEQNNMELAQQKEKLQSTLQYLSDIKRSLDASSILVITNERGIITDVNDKFCEISRYMKKELIGKPHKIINSGYHDSSFFRDLWKTIQSGGIWKGKVRNRAKDGSYYWVDNTIVPFINESGKVYQYMSIQHDITYQVENEEKLKRMNHWLQALAEADGLTTLGNRRFFDDALKKQWRYAVQDSAPLSAILLDVDYFKLFNDHYGHQAGDECLKQVARAVKSALLREGDISARYGGEEFVVLLPNTNREGALIVAERIRTAVESLQIPHQKSQIHSVVTVSVGVATLFPNRITHMKDLIAIADKALYRSKREGRNKTTCLTTSLEEHKSNTITVSESNLYINDLINEYVSSLYEFDQNTWEHSNRVAYYAIQLAEAMNVSIEMRQDIYMAGLLHDIGKTSIPFSILNKPSRLTDEEYEVIKEHPILSYDKLIRHKSLQEKNNLLDAVLYHHERWDGKGYPSALLGERIPFSARILAVADAFDAMTTDRIYQKGLSIEQSLEEVKRNKGTQFDPDIAEIFYQLFSHQAVKI